MQTIKYNDSSAKKSFRVNGTTNVSFLNNFTKYTNNLNENYNTNNNKSMKHNINEQNETNFQRNFHKELYTIWRRTFDNTVLGRNEQQQQQQNHDNFTQWWFLFMQQTIYNIQNYNELLKHEKTSELSSINSSNFHTIMNNNSTQTSNIAGPHINWNTSTIADEYILFQNLLSNIQKNNSRSMTTNMNNTSGATSNDDNVNSNYKLPTLLHFNDNLYDTMC